MHDVDNESNANAAVKSKYQVRSIVEIYENPQIVNSIDIGSYRKSTKIEETQSHKVFPVDASELSSNATIPVKGKINNNTNNVKNAELGIIIKKKQQA